MSRTSALCLVTFLATAAAAQTPEEMARAREHVQAAFAARESGAMGAYAEHLGVALRLRPGHPELIYLLAGARAMQGDTVPALRLLRCVASMGLALPAGEDEAFASLRHHPEFLDVVARLAANAEPTGSAAMTLTLADHRAMLPEGLTHDPATGAFFLSGVHGGQILRITETGAATVFVDRSPDTWAFMGLTLDPEHRMLWAATTGAEPFRGLEADDEGRAALVVYDADSGTPLGRHAPPGGGPHFLGDIALGPDGTVYASNGLDGTVYALDPGAPPDAPLRRLLPAGTLASAQGIAPARDALFVADYSKGIFRVSPATGTAVRLPAPPVTALLGIDGLVPFQGDLIAIQNGTRPNRILRLHLERDGRAIAEVEVLAAALPEWAEPTQGTVVDGRFHFVANSQWPAFQDGAPDPAELDPPRIMWLDPGR